MYEVYLDGRILDYPGDSESFIIDPVLELALNDAGSFEFLLPPCNPEYKNIQNRQSVVTVVKDGKEIFNGEIRECGRDYDNIKECYAVGEMSYLYDSIQPQAEYHNLSPRQILETWLNIHNSQVEEKKKMYVGIVTIHDNNDSLYRYTNYETTLDAIRGKLLDKLGGYLRVRKDGGKRYLDWVTLEDYGVVCRQPIMFGENLMDYTENVSSAGLATACVPLGARLEKGKSDIEALEKYTDITSVNDGKDYVYIQEAVERFGWIKKVVKWDDVYTPSILKEKARMWLQDNQYEEMTLKIDAIDLSILSDVEYDAFELGGRAHAIAEPYGLDRVFPIQSKKLYLHDADRNILQLGNNLKKTYTKEILNTQRQTDSRQEEVRITTNWLQSAIDNTTQMLTGNKGGYRLDEYDENGLFLRTLYMDAPNKEQAMNIIQIGPQGIGFSNSGFDGPYENAWTIDGVLLGKFIKANSVTAEALSQEYVSEVEKKINLAQTGAEEYTDDKLGGYYTKVEVETSIKAAGDEILITAQEHAVGYTDERLKNYYSKAEINVKTDEILLSAEKKAELYTDGVLKSYYTKAQIDVKTDSITQSVTKETTERTNAVALLSSQIQQTAESISLKVSKGDISSEISQESGSINIKANRISITSDSFTLKNNGEIIAKDADIQGSIRCSSSDYWITMGNAVIEAGFKNSRYAQIDGAAGYLDSSRRALQIKSWGDINLMGPLYVATSANSGYVYQTRTENISVVTQIDDLGDGGIRWWTGTYSFINGLLT